MKCGDPSSESFAQAPSTLLDKTQVPVGTPLAWPILDQDGALLLDAGTVVPSEAQRDFLFAHFQPCKAEAGSGEVPIAADSALRNAHRPLTLDAMHMSIGAALGIRSQLGMGGEMHPSRLIGFSPNHALFVTPPLDGRQPLPLTVGKNVEIVAVGRQAVFWFVCTVEATCKHPFEYLVLSQPGGIRRLRERKAVRVRTRLAVRYGVDLTSDTVDGLGIGSDLSAHGMSLAAAGPLGRVNDRVRVTFMIKTADLEFEFQAVAVIRNVQSSATSDAPTTHGLEFDQLGAQQQIALKTFIFDQDNAISHWS